MPVLGPPKTRKSVRTVSIPDLVTAELQTRSVGRRPDQLVFPGPAGIGQQAWTKRFHRMAWHPAVAASGIGKKPRVHDLRHAHASWLIAQGVHLPMIQARLGHESINTTISVYGHLAPEAHQQMALVIDTVMTPAVIPLAVTA
jgi:integrase